jgi:RNA polymerase sigma factor (sigma-70 family)
MAMLGEKIGSAVSIRDAMLSRIYRAHFRELCLRLRWVYKGGPPDPEDLAQTAFEKLSEFKDLSRIENPRAFLFRTAVNIGLNAIERNRVARRFAERELAAANTPVLEENTPEDVYSLKQRLERTQAAFGSLTAKQKEIVTRSRILGQTYEEIQAETGWSQADISRQLNAALNAMQIFMGQD